jgi:sulfhydrogenase subunit beta (sulfur reductase)
MICKKLSLAALDGWVDALVGKHTVFGPRVKEGAPERFVYGEIGSAAELRLDHDVTILPPKKYFLPPREALLSFEGPAAFRSVFEEQPCVLFGVHPYDVAALTQMDAILGKNTCDPHYQVRRQNAAIVACDVQTPSANVFAGCMGTATVKAGFDVLLTRVDDAYVAQAGSDRGERLLQMAGALPEADSVSLGRREQVWQDAPKLLRRHTLKCPVSALPELLERAYAAPVWEKKAAECYSCGSCLMVCPTCVCFDVQDEVNWDLKSGTRLRRWDGCLLSDFALVAGGHNFRRHREERYRHRFYRKAKYLHSDHGFVACVGCGRCITACTTDIANPVELYNALAEG